MKKILIGSLLILSTSLFAQENGIRFEHNLSWKEILQQAKEQNKFIFVDCFTTWCGPCAKISKELFPLPEMGAFFNNRFINVKVQMDKTPKDDAYVKAWYSDAAFIQKEYGVGAFPTFLYFTPEGELVHRVVGTSSSAAEFIGWSEKAFDPSTQYYTRLNDAIDKKQGNEQDLRELLTQAVRMYDKVKINQITEMLIALWKNEPGPQAIAFADSFTTGSTDYCFGFLLKNKDAVNRIKGAQYTEKKLCRILIGEELYPVMTTFYQPGDTTPLPDFGAMSARLQKAYPTMADVLKKAIELEKFRTSCARSDTWRQQEQQLVNYVNTHLAVLGPAQRASFAGAASRHSQDQKVLKDALRWMRSALEAGHTSPQGRATYANLLYKTGNSKDGIEAMKDAIRSAPPALQKNYQAALDEMIKNAPAG